MPETPPDVAAAAVAVTQAVIDLTPLGQMALMRATATGSNPCIARGLFMEQLAFVGPAIADINNAGARAAGFLHLAVRESIQRQGRANPGYTGGQRLARFALTTLSPQRLIPAQILQAFQALGAVTFGLGYLGATTEWVEDALPAGSELASGAWRQDMSNTGTRISNGVYLKDGLLRGARVRSMIEQWLDYQAANVNPSDVPAARSQLINAYGKWTGGGPYGLFEEGDPPKSGSRAYNANALLEQLLELVDLSTARCDQYEGLTVQAGRTRLEIEAEAAEVSAEEARARTLRSNVIVFAGLAIGAFVAVRRV
jgi:hypothetical protein